jgi:hypothetical protein
MDGRLRAVLPTRWFPDVSPVLDSLLSGLARGWSSIYDLLQYVKAQTRTGTASDIWLDIIALDFFSGRVVRQPNQSDDSFRITITREIFRERGTRAAIVSALQDLTGQAPIVFEPARTSDTGGYTSLRGHGGGVGYGVAGGWGNLGLPFQCFVTAYRPASSGIATVSGWCDPAGGYCQGALEYADLGMIQGQVTDDAIYQAIADVLPVAAIAWTSIVN